MKQLLSFEVANGTDGNRHVLPRPSANWFVDISDQWRCKQEALVAYASEMRDWPRARSIEAVEHLERWRGAQWGVEAAEAFCLLQQLV